MNKLRECPFCGSNDVHTKTSAAVVPSGLTMVLCYGCGATVSFDRKERKDQAIAAWNAHACDPEIEALKEENLGLALRLNSALQGEKELRDAIERGKLVRLPCSIGDNIYYLTGRNAAGAGKSEFNQVKESRVVGFYLDQDGVQVQLDRGWTGNHGTYGVYGKTIFATREEAEAALVKEGQI